MEKIDSKEQIIRLMNQYKNLVFSVCLKLTGDYFVAEDITQETFLSAYEHWQDFDGAAEKAWICRIASNKCIDYKRAAERKSMPTAEEEMPELVDTENDPLHMFVGNEVMENLKNSCRQLSSPYDEVAYMHFVDGMTAKEIAERTDRNLKTIQTQIYRAKEMLKKIIRREDLLS